MVMDPTLPRISVRDLLMQAFLTGWELSDKAVSQDEYLQSSIQVIEVLQVEPESLYAEEGLGLPDGEEVDHLDDWLRADGKWLYYGGGEFLPHPVVPRRGFGPGKAGPAGRTGRRPAVSGGPVARAAEPLQRRKLRQFQPGAAALLTMFTLPACRSMRKETLQNAAF